MTANEISMKRVNKNISRLLQPHEGLIVKTINWERHHPPRAIIEVWFSEERLQELDQGAFPMTTTDTKAKRTEGEATINTSYPTTINLGVSNRKAKIVIIGMVMDGEDVANAEYIRKAWNMHEELVQTIKNAVVSLEICKMPRLDEMVASNEQIMETILVSFRALLSKAQLQP